MVSGVVYFRGHGHWGGSEVLHLLEMEVEFLGFGGEHGHVRLAASGMAGDEVGDELLFKAVRAVHVVEKALEVVE